jgi:hypothetical protein
METKYKRFYFLGYVKKLQYVKKYPTEGVEGKRGGIKK